MQLHEFVRAGITPTVDFAAPGAQIPAGTGAHGPGVKTPRAAAVRAAVAGLAMLLHRPNGTMFVNGIASAMEAIGCPWMVVRFSGSTFSVDGARPMVQLVIAPLTTGVAMASP